MLNFFRRRVGAKIALGYSLILILMVSIGLLAIIRLNQIGATVTRLTGNLEVDQQLSGQIVLHIMSARFYAARYVNTYAQSDLDAFDDEFAYVQTLISQASLADPTRAAVLSEIGQNVDAYGEAFAQVSALISHQQNMQGDVLNVQELILDNKMTALRVHINTLNDPLIFLTFGNAQTHTQAMRLNRLKYQAENDERYTVLIQKNYQQALESLAGLQDLLQDETQRQNVADAYAAVQTYYAGFQAIQADTVQLRHLFSAQLDVLEPKISELATLMQANIEQEFQQQNAASQKLVLQTRFMLVLATLAAISAGIFLGVFLPRRITAPLQQVNLASQQIASVDLQTLSRQLSTLARGDVRLDLKVTAQPLAVYLDDEVGQMARSFNQVITGLHEAETAFGQMSAYLQEMAGAAQGVARGDLSVQVLPRSAEDVLGNSIGDMLANLRRAQERVSQQLERLETLRRVDAMIAANREICDTMQFLLEQGLGHLKMESGEIYIVSQGTRQLECVSCVWQEMGHGDLAQPLAEYVLERNQRLVINHPLNSDLNEACRQALKKWAACCGTPLIAQGETKGILLLFGQDALAPDSEWLDFLDTLAGQAAIAIANSELVHNLEERVVLRTREMEEARQFTQTLLASYPVAVVVIDLEDRITDWNSAAENLFGYTPAEVKGRHIDDVVTKDPALREEARQLTAQGQKELVRVFTQRNRKDGKVIDVEIAGTTVFFKGQRVAGLALYHDITELQQARQMAEEATRAKSAFLATMSHEIRTPMNGVIGMTSLLLDTPLTAEQREFVETIRQSGDALLVIINDILDYSKIEAGHLELEVQPFNLNDCIESAMDLVAPNAVKRSIEVAYLPVSGVPEAILGDVTRLRQILVNLLTNAVKFTDSGEVVIELKLDGEDPSTAVTGQQLVTLHFSVRDTGIGIPPARMDRLFRSFSQVDASTTRKYGGTGLGLAICKRLVELMGGKIWAESEGVVGKGATFHFTIQAQVAKDIPSRELANILITLTGRRVLIVDDNATNRQVLHYMAQAWGMHPIVASSGSEALKWIDQNEPLDVAILDVQMPEMDGLTLAHEISKRRDLNDLPLVMFTSLGRRDEPPPGVAVAAYLYKPIKSSTLYNALVTIFSSHLKHVRIEQSGQVVFDPGLGSRHPLRILLAEDHPVNQQVALNSLARMGYRAEVAANGLEVIQAFERQDYDLVLMDVQMPEMDGVEATHRLRSELPPDRQPYIVALTANVLPGDRESYIAAGMNDYMGKPFSTAQLQRILQHCLPIERSIAQELAAPLMPPSAAAAPTALAFGQPDDLPPAIDLARLEEYFPDREQDLDSFVQMVVMLLDDTSERLKGLHQFIAQGNSEQAWRSAHAIKGASLTFGAVRFSSLCKELESMGRSGAVEDAPAKLAEIETEYQRVRQELTHLAHLEKSDV